LILDYPIKDQRGRGEGLRLDVIMGGSHPYFNITNTSKIPLAIKTPQSTVKVKLLK